MSNITKATTREELAALVTQALRKEGLDPVLVGGAVVSIYTDNKYESRDLDFIVSASSDVVNEVMKKMGFKKSGKNFYHPKSEFTVEFPMGPLAIGDQEPVKPEGSSKSKERPLNFSRPPNR